MAINFNSTASESQALAEINTTPLIDVMLVILVMLIITIPMQTHAVKLDLPRITPQHLVPPPVVLLQLDFDGTAIWNGNRVADRATLDSYLAQAAIADPQPEIHLRADRLTKYDDVARVLADAQRLGVTRIGFIDTEKYGPQ